LVDSALPSRTIFLLLPCVLILGLLNACGSNAPAPVEDRRASSSRKPMVKAVHSQRLYRVQKGDTLYSIAFRYGLDVRKLAAANRIASPYTIFPSQSLALREAALMPPPRTTQPVAGASDSRKAALPVPARKPAAAPVPIPSAAPVPAAATKRPTNTTGDSSSAEFVGKKVSQWRWPSRGKVMRGYSKSVHKGIDIDGKYGDSVSAVADGIVVYAGTGIVGLGELLIIKHNDIYLSAYGHNSELLVAEGAIVRVGQRIANKGNSGTDTVKLHFEIRKAGKPIDPQRLLPPRP